jgi:hypothetical protein
MNNGPTPRFVPTEKLHERLRSKGIAFTALPPLKLGFGQGNDQYRFYEYPGPADDETMALYCEWHTEDFFNVDSGPHLAIGMRGPTLSEPHRGRGLAIGILANAAVDPANRDALIPLFEGCPDAPGGPSFFIEDFSRNDGAAAVCDWQLSRGRELPQLQRDGVYRIDIHVSAFHVWAAVWKVTARRSLLGARKRRYDLLGETCCLPDGPGFSGDPLRPCPEHPVDRGQGNAFIGTGFAHPDTRSWVDNITIAHWKNPA